MKGSSEAPPLLAAGPGQPFLQEATNGEAVGARWVLEMDVYPVVGLPLDLGRVRAVWMRENGPAAAQILIEQVDHGIAHGLVGWAAN